jgi:ANTAR domain/GAF domain
MTALSGPQFEQFLRDFRKHHERLRSLIAFGPTEESGAATAGASTAELIREIDEIGEQLLVADEELRVQSEELASAQDNLADVLSAFEHLFMNAPAAYVQTDADGVIVRVNHAASRLIASVYGGKPRTLVSLFRMSDRGTVRDLLSRVRTRSPDAAHASADLPAVEVSLQHADTALPVVLSAQLVVPGGGADVVHWQIRPRSATAPEPTQRGGALAALLALTGAVKDIAAAPDVHTMVDRITAAARTVVPGCRTSALLLRRARDRAEVASSSDPGTRSVTDLQRSVHEGPAVDALRGGVIRTASMAADPRWPRLGAHRGESELTSALAVPLVGPRGPFGALVCYSPELGAFDADAEMLAASLAAHAAPLFAARELEGNLRAGMETRERIGQAVGVLMERHRLTSQQAFDLLVYVSQRTHRKLRDIANWVTETGEDPQAFLDGVQAD